MKPGFKFFSFTSAAVLLSCSWCVVHECGAVGSSYTAGHIVGIFGVLSTILAGSQHANALPPLLFQKRLGSPMPQIGRPISLDDDDDSDEDEEDLLQDESQPRVEPHITPLNRDQCLAKLLCGMSVPVTGGNSKKNYYSEYANIVSKFFEAFPPDDELQSKESIETYDDYSNEDDGKPTRMNSRRKPLNSSRVDATAPTLQLFDLALVDVAKPEDMARNRTRKAAFEKVLTGNRIARARRIVDNLGQKLQTVRQCQSIAGCPFSFKQLREKIKKKESQRVSSNVPLPPGPVWPGSPKRKNEPAPPPASYMSKPHAKPHSRPRPLPPTSKPESQSTELFSPEEPAFPFKDTNKGDDEMEEIFGPPPVSKKPLGFHQGVDENFNYDYSPDKPWRPGSPGSGDYGIQPWQSRPPRPQPNPYSRPNHNDMTHRRPPPRQRPRPGGNPPQKRYPPQNYNQQQPQRRPAPPAPQVVKPRPKKPTPRPITTTTTPRSPFPKKKISYLNSPYNKPNMNSDDDEGSEDINKVAPFELIADMDGESETKKTTTTSKPEQPTESPTSASKKKKKVDSDDSDEYDDDDYDDNYEDEEEDLDDDDDYSDEEEDDKETKAKKTKKENKEKQKRKKQQKKKKAEEEEEEDDDTPTSSTTTPAPKKKKIPSPYFDDENEDIHEIWTKLNYATTGGNQEPPEKLKKKNKTSESNKATSVAADEDEEDDDADADDANEEEEEEEDSKTSTEVQKIRASASSASNEDDADDEIDDENASKPKRYRTKSKKKKKSELDTQKDDEIASDIAEPVTQAGKTEKSKKASKTKKNKKTSGKKEGSSEEEDSSAASRRKHVMMEIGGRPIGVKPESNTQNAQKTSSLIGNRFKFQFINPYGPAPPSDSNLPGAYTPMRNSLGPTSSPSGSSGSSGSAMPFKFKLNPGYLGNLAAGAGMVPLGGFPSSASGSMSVEIPDPHHPPPGSGYLPPPPQNPLQHQQRQENFATQPSYGGASGGSGSLFKLNPLPALQKLFKRPSFDPMAQGLDGHHGAPPAAAFHAHGTSPASGSYKREKSPASGSSKPAKKSTKSKASKGRKGKF